MTSRLPFARRAFPALMLAFALGAAASSAPAQDIPRQDPDHCVGQREIRPLQPLTLVTAKGRFPIKVEFAGTERQRT